MTFDFYKVLYVTLVFSEFCIELVGSNSILVQININVQTKSWVRFIK